MTYVIEITPDRLRITADLAHDEIGDVIDRLTVVRPLIGAGANRSEEITREPKQAKALRAERAVKEITPAPAVVTAPEPQNAAVLLDETEPVATTPAVDARLARDERIRELWPTDWTLAMISEEVGCSVPSVSLTAKRLGLPSRAHRSNHRPANPPEATQAPAPTPPVKSAPPETNAHVFTMHGVSLTHDAISFNGKEMPITESHYRLLHALLRAAPHPIGIPHLLSKVYPGKAKTEAEVVFGIVVKDVERNLPMVDLALKNMKGIGISLTGSDAG